MTAGCRYEPSMLDAHGRSLERTEPNSRFEVEDMCAGDQLSAQDSRYPSLRRQASPLPGEGQKPFE